MPKPEPQPQPTLLTAPTSTEPANPTAPTAPPTLTVNQIQTVLLAAARMLHGRLDGDRARREGMQRESGQRGATSDS
jgi:hypothetical protein